MTLSYGIDQRYLDRITEVFRDTPAVQKAYLYGSRARGDFKNYSDIDLAFSAPDMDFSGYLGLKGKIDDIDLIFKVDLVHLDKLDKESLKNTIERDAILLYNRADVRENAI